MMTELEKYQKVNKCETFEELAQAIESFADVNGNIKGKKQHFEAKQMANCCRRYNEFIHNSLTREYGIRQQAMYILFYLELENNKSLNL